MCCLCPGMPYGELPISVAQSLARHGPIRSWQAEWNRCAKADADLASMDWSPSAEREPWRRRRNCQTKESTLWEFQRGGARIAFDRVLATRLGMAAVDSAAAGRWGTMVSLRGTNIVNVGFDAALGRLKTVPEDRYREAAVLFG